TTATYAATAHKATSQRSIITSLPARGNPCPGSNGAILAFRWLPRPARFSDANHSAAQPITRAKAVAAQQLAGGHDAFAGWLHLLDGQAAGAGGHYQPLAGGFDDRAWCVG